MLTDFTMDERMKQSFIGGSRLKVFLYGFFIWTVWILFYAVFFKIQIGLSWPISFATSAGSYYPYALLSILIWVVCRRVPFARFPLPILISIHFVLSILFSALWLFVSYGLWYLQEGSKIFSYFESYGEGTVGAKQVFGWQFLFGMITYLLVAGIFYTIIYYNQFREKQLQEAELKILTRDAELKALKMQIHPHFLFNSMNSINALVTRNPKQARGMIAKLSELLRVSLESRDRMFVSLKEELDVARLYLEIEKMRFQDRMEVHEEIDPGLLGVSFPAMVLQPLLENAVIHGIADHRGKGEIRLMFLRQDDFICCRVTNTVGKRISKGRKESQGNGTGLSNIRQRLDLLYGESYSFDIERSDPGRFEVRLLLPFMDSDGDRWIKSKR